MTPEQKRRLVERMLAALEATAPGSVEERRSLAALDALENSPTTAEPVPPPALVQARRAPSPAPPKPADPAPKVVHQRRQRSPEVILDARAPVYDDSPLRVTARDSLEKERLEGVRLPAPGSPLELTTRYQTAKQLAARYRVSIVTVHRWLQKLPPQSYSSALVRASKRGPLSIGYKLLTPTEEQNDAPRSRRAR